MIVAPVAGDSSVLAASSVPAERIAVEVSTVNGSGCPAGTATVAASSDNSFFRVSYADYVARGSVGGAGTDSRKNCQLSLEVRVPNGYTYSISEARYRGKAHLASGVTGLQVANYYFQGSSSTVSLSHSFDGPYDGEWQTRDVAGSSGLGALGFSPCGGRRNLNINTELRVNDDAADSSSGSYISMDSSDGSLYAVFYLNWRQCG
jgi:hypothetical protein